MPPKPINIDGISKPPSGPLVAAPATPGSAKASAPASIPLNQAATSSKPTESSPLAVILITVVVMILLIALAYLAYTKSK